MDWELGVDNWTKQDCYDAMILFVDYYMVGDEKDRWNALIREFIAENRFPPGKGFLNEIDQAIKISTKPSMKNRAELYEKICGFCI